MNDIDSDETQPGVNLPLLVPALLLIGLVERMVYAFAFALSWDWIAENHLGLQDVSLPVWFAVLVARECFIRSRDVITGNEKTSKQVLLLLGRTTITAALGKFGARMCIMTWGLFLIYLTGLALGAGVG